MVAFGSLIDAKRGESPFPPEMFLDYERLKSKLYELQVYNLRGPVAENAMSLSVPPATNAAGMPLHPGIRHSHSISEDKTADDGDESDDYEAMEGAASRGATAFGHDDFLALLDAELKKMDRFAHNEVVKVRKALRTLEANPPTSDGFEDQCRAAERDFLRIEEYVNVNVTGVRKLLKKHDKLLPHRPIMGYVMARMHDMRWVRNDYSDVVVRISRLYASLGESGPAPDARDFNSEQNFVRATSKFWVRAEDLSAVKLTVSRHLPVYLQEIGVKPAAAPGPGASHKAKESHAHAHQKDSQLVNSVYLDNAALELYHGRLDKSPGAVALRLRWYGTGEPTLVFVERKTHRDSWTGDESVKERFNIKPEDVPLLLNGEYDVDAHVQRQRLGGKKSEAAIRGERILMDEVTQLIATKGLVPTVRSQCMRVAFQLAHTNAVRVSMDSNLCLISEVASPLFSRWYRDPSLAIPLSEITRFPFAVLEIKLALAEADDLPEWVKVLVDSSKLIPVHKFSKFIHGCAVLMPDEVQSLPYWIDDPQIADSIRSSGGESILRSLTSTQAKAEEAMAPTFSTKKAVAARRSPPLLQAVGSGETSPAWRGAAQQCNRENCFCASDECGFASEICCNPLANNVALDDMQKLMPQQRVQPKLIFANERTLIHWLHIACILAVFGSVGFAASPAKAGLETANERGALYAAMLSAFACCVAAYALAVFSRRNELILTCAQVEWGDPFGPTIVGGSAIAMLCVAWVVELANYGTADVLG